jgi:multidrug resistance efflux pump
MKNNRIGIFLITALIALSIGLAILGPMLFRKQATSAPKETQPAKSASVVARGAVESEDEADIMSRVSGTIVEMLVSEGDAIKKGQPLVVFEKERITAKLKTAEAELLQARIRLRELKTGSRAEDVEMAKSNVARNKAVYEQERDDYERLKRLFSKNAAASIDLERAKEKMNVSLQDLKGSEANLKKLRRGPRKEEIEQAEAMVERAQSEVDYNKALLEDCTIYAPMDGVVQDRFKNAQETVDVNTPLLKIINDQKLRVRAEVEESDLGKVSVGQHAEVTTEMKDKTYNGTVYKVSPVVNRRVQRTFDPMAAFDINTQTIYIRLDDYSGVRSGMSVTVRFQE